MSKLTYTTDSDNGYYRKGRGKGFEYFHQNGKKLKNDKTIERISHLAIPPMWKDVWVCKNPNGHLQATGFDAKGRKQYLYNQQWSESQNSEKFEKLTPFAYALPTLRHTTKNHLRKKGWPREKVLALLVSVLDISHVRIGNLDSKRENETYGLTTLRNKHLGINGHEVTFDFKAKGGKHQHVSLKSRKITRLIQACSELPGYEVFQYVDEDGDKRSVHSQEVNTYLQQITEAEITAKDFRTWGGTVAAIECYESAVAHHEKHPQRKLSNIVVKKVAQRLNNTLAVCRKYYIHPAVIDTLSEPGVDIEAMKEKAQSRYKKLKPHLTDDELMALYIIEST